MVSNTRCVGYTLPDGKVHPLFSEHLREPMLARARERDEQVVVASWIPLSAGVVKLKMVTSASGLDSGWCFRVPLAGCLSFAGESTPIVGTR